MPEELKPGDYVQSLEKGLKVLRAFDADHVQMTISEVAHKSGLDRANARRILLTLQHLGYLSCVDGKNFALTPKILSLGYSYLSGLPFRELAMPIMQELTHELNESCSLSVLDGTDIVYVARVHTKRIMTISLAIGTRLPAYATSMGKVLLAGLPKPEALKLVDQMEFEVFTHKTLSKKSFLGQMDNVRQQCWAIADEEIEIGVRSIACAVKDKNNITVAALNVSGHASRVGMEELEEKYLPSLKKSAARIEEALTNI